MFVVGIGGTTRSRSSSEAAARHALAHAHSAGARVELVSGQILTQLPIYTPGVSCQDPEVTRFLALVRASDGVIISSPGYHGSISGSVKNALDYLEELRSDARPYLDGRAVGCIACGTGWQASVTTLQSLRSVVHALRGWPTPLGVAINSSGNVFRDDGCCLDVEIGRQLDTIAQQVVTFAQSLGSSRRADHLGSLPSHTAF